MVLPRGLARLARPLQVAKTASPPSGRRELRVLHRRPELSSRAMADLARKQAARGGRCFGSQSLYRGDAREKAWAAFPSPSVSSFRTSATSGAPRCHLHSLSARIHTAGACSQARPGRAAAAAAACVGQRGRG